MTEQEMILALGNAIIMMDDVETKGEKNLNNLLAAMQQTRKVYKHMKERSEANENHDEQGKNI